MVTYNLLSPVYRRLQMKGQGKDECVPMVTEESADARSGKESNYSVLCMSSTCTRLTPLSYSVAASSAKQKGSFSELKEYARQLVGSSEQLGKGNSVSLPSASAVLGKGVEGQWEAEAGGIAGCREAVEIITRNPRKGVSFLF
jgi:hypothetical protein